MKMQFSIQKKEYLKIGFVFDDSLDRPDGVSQYVKTLGKWLSNQGHEVRYLVGETKIRSWQGGRVYSLSRNIGVSFNGNRLSTPLPASRQKIKKIISDEKFDVLHIQVPYSPFMAKKIIDAADAHTAIVGTFHILPAGRWAVIGTKALKFFNGKSQKRIDRMLSVSQSAANFEEATLKIKSNVVPNVVDLNKFKHSKKIARNRKRIVFLGRLVERKGCMQLLRALRVLVKNRHDVQLLVAGDGPERKKLEKFCKKYNLIQNVTFLGFIEESKKSNLLASADIACFPSLYGESFGIVLIEAMAAGAGVVIGANNPGYQCVLDSDVLFDPRNTAAFAQFLEVLLNESEVVKKNHSRQQKQVKSYDVEVVGPVIVGIYQSVVAKRDQKSHN